MQPISVLVVEDEPIVRMDTVDQLTNDGFQVLEAANADEAIQILERNAAISVLFTDIDMPGRMDGLMLSTVVRNRWPTIRIFVASECRTVTDMPDGSVFFSKPYRYEAIASSIRQIVAG